MAEVQGNANGSGASSHRKGPRQRKKSTKIDMTAMVDVAFLLLTFFILTATMAQPHALEVNKPPKDDLKGVEVQQSKVLTLVLGADDRIHYWVGNQTQDIQTTGFGQGEVRKVVMDHLNLRPDRCVGKNPPKGCWDPIIVIKPTKASRFKNLADILDEMLICQTPKHAIADLTPEDSTLLADRMLR